MSFKLTNWQKELTEYYKKQEGHPYGICGFCTSNLKKWKLFKEEQKDHIIKEQEFSIILDNGEVWKFINLRSKSIRGYRFYKIVVDKDIERRIIDWYLLPSCVFSCKSFEWI